MGLRRDLLADAIDRHGSVARVVIAAHAGSSPREAGAAMLGWSDGQQGTIGGGALEHDATLRARDLLAADAPFAPQFVTQPLGPALGQCCGGSVTLVIEHVDAATLTTIPETGLHARCIASSPVDPPLWVRAAHRDARAGRPVATTLRDGWLVEPVDPERLPVWIWGAGHVGRALVATLSDLPLDLTWIDDAPDRFPDPIPLGVTRLIAARPQDLARHAPAHAHHIVLTYSHALDLEICHAVLSHASGFLGLIGSDTKRARFVRRLAALGHPPDRIAHLTCPIGDKALGKHPRAIAIGVAHALLTDQAAARRGQANKGQLA